MFLRRKKSDTRLPIVTTYPSATFLKTEKGYFYVFNNSKRYRVLSNRVLASWSPHRIVETTEADPAVSKLRISSKLKFRNGSLIYLHKTGTMYLIENGKKRPVTNPLVLENLGAKPSDAIWVTPEEANLHEDGEPVV